MEEEDEEEQVEEEDEEEEEEEEEPGGGGREGRGRWLGEVGKPTQKILLCLPLFHWSHTLKYLMSE